MLYPTKQLVYGSYASVAPTYNSSSPGGSFKFEVPSPTIEINRTLQYEFRVLETVKNGEVTKVGLQVKTYEVDHYGSRSLLCDWTDIERVRLEI